ncbi:MAG: hypothetical protein A3K03_05700 [Bdellovibrionales bacterium RIFOXYD1_FULL_44_7]|nr:MAG: hypothetical protein A3K03_05700 [Bdellovibrionales bacterium RIFOXYD1_FULL_44_7]
MVEVSFLGPLSAFASAFFWSIGSTKYSQLSKSYTPFSINFARASVAFPLFTIAAFFSAGGSEGGLGAFSVIKPLHFIYFFVSMTCSYGLGDVLFLLSTRSLGVPGALAIASSYPLWTSVLGIHIKGEPFIPLQIAGVLLALIGIIVVVLNAPSREQVSSGFSIIKNAVFMKVSTGVVLAATTSVMWAANSFIVSEIGKDIPLAVANSGRMFAALVISFVLSKLLIPKASIFLPRRLFTASLWLFFYEAFLGSYFFIYGLAKSPLIVGVTITALAPVLAVPMGWILKTERFSFFRTMGVVCVVVGVILLMANGGKT